MECSRDDALSAADLGPKHPKEVEADPRAPGMSQVGMADTLGFPTVHPTNISGSERGLREPPYPVLLKYARFVGVSTDVLIDDKARLD